MVYVYYISKKDKDILDFIQLKKFWSVKNLFQKMKRQATD